MFILLLCCLLFTFVNSAIVHNVFIAANGIDTPKCGASSSPCASWRVAQANLWTPGDVIFNFGAGTFLGQENCGVLLQRNATFRGQSTGTTIQCQGEAFPKLSNNQYLTVQLQLLNLHNTTTSLSGNIDIDLVNYKDSSVHLHGLVTVRLTDFVSSNKNGHAVFADRADIHLTDVLINGYETAIKGNDSFVFLKSSQINNVDYGLSGVDLTIQLDDMDFVNGTKLAMKLEGSSVDVHSSTKLVDAGGVALLRSSVHVHDVLTISGHLGANTQAVRLREHSAFTVGPAGSFRLTNITVAQGMLFDSEHSVVSLRNSVLASLKADAVIGAYRSNVTIAKSMLIDNQATSIYANFSSFQVSKTVVANNVGSVYPVGAIFATAQSDFLLRDCRLYANSYLIQSTPPASLHPAGAIVVENSLLQMSGVAAAKNGANANGVPGAGASAVSCSANGGTSQLRFADGTQLTKQGSLPTVQCFGGCSLIQRPPVSIHGKVNCK